MDSTDLSSGRVESALRGGVTKERILDAAEHLFAEHGFAATSLRKITAAAQVNLASVNYHFRSKESLIVAVLIRKMSPINARRIELLDAAEKRAGEGPLMLEDVLDAFVGPVLRARQEGGEASNFPKLLGRVYTEPGDWVARIFPQALGEVAARFRVAFLKALPASEFVDAMWSMHFAIGSLAHYLAAPALLSFLLQEEAATLDVEVVQARLVRFMAGGMRALAAKKEAAG